MTGLNAKQGCRSSPRARIPILSSALLNSSGLARGHILSYPIPVSELPAVNNGCMSLNLMLRQEQSSSSAGNFGLSAGRKSC